MKKVLFILFAFMVSLNAFAFKFDGIELNDPQHIVTRAVSTKGYVMDEARKCLKGNCHGHEIFLSFNFKDVSAKNHVGQLIIDVPMSEPNAYEVSVQLLNVLYHLADGEPTSTEACYAVSEDGTTLTLSKTNEGIKLTYNTPYYKVAKK